MSKFYVSGLNGFIGRHVYKYLTGLGHKVFGVKGTFITTHEPYEFIHLAAYGNHYHQKDVKELIQANILLLEMYLDATVTDENCKKFYNISTSAIQLPTDTLYSVSKRFGELMVESYSDLRFVNIRPYSVYGPGEADHRFIPTVIRALHSGETIKLDPYAYHDWILVSDFIEAMFKGNTNIGTGKCYSNMRVVQILEELSGMELKYEKAELRSYDNKNWKAPFGVDHQPLFYGLKQTYEWFTQKDIRDKQEA